MQYTFNPPFYLSHPTIQTMAGSFKLRALGRKAFKKSNYLKIIETGQGVKLQTAITTTRKKSGPLAILLHGWEGSINSAYIVTTASFLFNNGWHVVRLNFRDHGNTHHLNSGLFYASLLDEVYDAIIQCCLKLNKQPTILCGFSLGGNFALRTALRWSVERPAGTNLSHVLAVSPVIDPAKTTQAVDQTRMIRAYFLHKWKKSLIKKQLAYPGKYNFEDVLKLDRIESITKALLQRHSHFANLNSYFRTYTLTGNRLASIKLPTTILASEDDPIIPVKDIINLNGGRLVRKIVLPRGGHNGFINGFTTGTWYFRYLAQLGKYINPRC